MKKHSRAYISASEVSEFVFCRLSWALKYQYGFASDQASREAQAIGELWHARQGRRFVRARTLETIGALLLALGLVTCIVLWAVMKGSK